MSLNTLPLVVVQTGVDSWPSGYKATVGLAGANVHLHPDDMHRPLTLTGDNGHGLKVTSLDVYVAAVLWQPGHLNNAIGCAFC
jgi:hypothetical protein